MSLLLQRLRRQEVRASFLAAVLLWSLPAQAQQGAANLFHEVNYSISGNVALVNDYLFRGRSLSDGKPAIQGGFDYTGIQSVFLGAWGSSGSQSIPVEFDVYGGIEPVLNDWSRFEVAVTAYLYPHVMDDSTWEGKLALHLAKVAVAYEYDFVLDVHYSEAGYRDQVLSWLAYRIRAGIAYQKQGEHSRPGTQTPEEPPERIWDGDAQLLFSVTPEFAANVGVVYHEEDGATALLGVRTEFEFLSWR